MVVLSIVTPIIFVLHHVLNHVVQSVKEEGMTSENYDFEFVRGEPPEEYTCPICTLIAHVPHQVTCCGRIICKGCLDRLKSANKNASCPMCRQPLTGTHFRDTRVGRAIDNLEIYCIHKNRGCTWAGRVKEITDHLKLCDQVDVKCKECKAVVMRGGLDSHLTSACSKRIHTCHLCDAKGSYDKITGIHKSVCPKASVSCPNEGCNAALLRQSLPSHHEVCPQEVVACPFAMAGCTSKVKRNALPAHERSFVYKHNQMSMIKLRELDKKLEEYEQQGVFTFAIKNVYSSKEREIYTYTSPCGYRLLYKVKKGVLAVTFRVYMARGEYDDTLTWPFRGRLTVELLNQVEDKNHSKEVSPYICAATCKASQEHSEKEIWHCYLPCYLQQHEKDDTIYLRVNVNTKKQWLKCNKVIA